jgi:hypothetical protein
MKDTLKSVIEASRAIQFDVLASGTIPDEGLPSYSQQVLPKSLATNTRSYIEKVLNQINGCYEQGWFDACAVMLRRLIETLIIETFEKHKISDKIKNQNEDFFYLSDLINATLNESVWNLGRNTRNALPKLKAIGDMSAHSRRYTARKWDIDKVIPDLRVVVEELLYIADLKRKA